MVALLKMPVRSEPSLRMTDYWADRRMFPRKETHATVEGRRLDHSLSARQMPRLQLDLRDVSVGGLSALVDQPLKAGEHLSVMFPPDGLRAAWGAFGRVIRCEESASGYRIAVEFDPLPAA